MTTTIPSTNAGTLTTQGVGSGLDIAGIVDKLVSVESAPLNRIKARESAFQTKLSAYGAARGALASFQTSVAALADPAAFSSFTATIGDATLASVAVDPTQSNSLSAGTHTLRVDSLATAQRTAAAGVPTTSTVIGSGSLTIDIGSWNGDYSTFTPNADAGSKTITIDSSNNTLVGIRDAINGAAAGVSAAIVNDGTGNRLVLSGTSTGNAHGFRVTSIDGDGNNIDAAGLSQLAFDPAVPGGMPQAQRLAQAANAAFSIDGIAISKPDNHVTDAIAGLTIDLSKVSDTATTTTTFSIARDSSTAKTNITNFVNAYNGIVSNLGSLTNYDATSKSAGVLNGDSSMRLITSRLQSLMASVVPVGGSVTMLGDIGITFNASGKLDLDAVKLSGVLTSNPGAVSRLFAKTGSASDAQVAFTGSTDKTQVGSYALAISRTATQGALTASTPAGLTITAGVNDTFALVLDGVSATVTLAPGIYSDADALATQVQAKINGTTAFATGGSSVSVSASGGALTLTSQRFGSASSLLASGGNGASGLFGLAPSATAGLDVAGTIDGLAFTGSGQTATGAGSTSTEGLRLTVTGSITGARGTVSFNRGIAAQINTALTEFLDKTNGLVTAATDSINSAITGLKKSEDAWNTRLVAIRARYTAQYNAMDTLLAKLNGTANYLTQQITAIQNFQKNN